MSYISSLGDHGANEEFREKLDQLTKAYDEELERLNLVANEFSAKLLQLLHDQAKVGGEGRGERGERERGEGRGERGEGEGRGRGERGRGGREGEERRGRGEEGERGKGE